MWRRCWSVTMILVLVLMPLVSVLSGPLAIVEAASANTECDRREEGDARTRYKENSAQFHWRGTQPHQKVEATLVLLQDICTCTGHETLVDPETGEEVRGECNEWRWREQEAFDKTKSRLVDTDLSFEQPKLMQLGANQQWDRICPAPWHATRGVYLPSWDHLEQDFRGTNQEEYQVAGQIFVKDVVEQWDGISHCEPDTLNSVRTVVNDKRGLELAFRFEDRFDIDSAVQAAVVGLPYDQVKVRLNPGPSPERPDWTSLAGMATYFWLEGVDEAPFTGFVVPVEGWGGYTLSAWVVVYASEITWEFGDGTSLTTTSRGVPWPQAEMNGVPHPAAVVKTYEVAGTFSARVRITWTARWGLREEHTTLCGIGTPCSPFIPIYTAGPTTSLQFQPFRVRQAQAVGVPNAPAATPYAP